MSLTYTTYKTALANLLAISPSDTNFLGILDQAISYTELRIQRDLDLVATIAMTQGSNMTAGSNTFLLPANIYILQQLMIDTGTEIVGLTPQSKEYMNAMYTSKTAQGTPVDFAVLEITNYDGTNTGQLQVFVGPTPSSAFPTYVTGTYRLTPISQNNSSNYLTNQMPDLYLAASMIFMSGWIRNFGSQADQPQMAQSWEGQYQLLLKSAEVEEARRKYQASAWTSMSPAAVATPTR